MRIRAAIFQIILVVSGMTQFAFAAPLTKTALIGRWDSTTYTGLRKGKPIGTIQFKPNTMVFTYRQDDT